MAGKPDADRVSEIQRLAASVCNYERLLKGEAAKLTQLYDGYGGDAWANQQAVQDIIVAAGMETNKLKAACNGAADVAPLGDLVDELYHIESV